MSADLLREAAKVLRADWPTGDYCPTECNCDSALSDYHPTADQWQAVANLLDAVSTSWGFEHKAGLSGCRRCTMKRPNGHGPCPACLVEDVARAILSREAPS